MTSQPAVAGQGHVCLDEKDAIALDRIDTLTRGCIPDGNFLEWHVPSLIDEEDIARCGYLTAFPGQLTVAATLDPAAHGRVVHDAAVSTGDLQYRRTFLTPAACLNIYPMLARRFTGENVVVTTRATVFRHETDFDGLTRLWEFPVREFVFAGDEAFVAARLREAAGGATRLAARLGIEAGVRAASDHFYPTLENDIRLAMQVRLGMKSELVAQVGGQGVPLASFNFHRTHFSGPCGFDRENTVVTGCAGFGLHRWLAATVKEVNKSAPADPAFSRP